MSYGLYDYDRRRRRRFWVRAAKFLFALAILGGLATFSYLVGVEQLKAREIALQEEIATLTAAKEQAERRAAQLQQIAQTAEIKASELEVRFQREVPTGELARLQELLAQKLAEGVDANRLAFIISQTGTVRNCTHPETKRFVLPTPLYRGANTSVTFANGAVTIGGEGASARNANGDAEAWFDPRQPVTLKFTQIDGDVSEATGMLPIQHSVVIGDKEYRFNIVESSARSFVEISGDTCAFP
ncbi:hypothetical protein [Indioceanicola profundi]|uniref:hypothetical protein n=1 Tax=Indioceanicola profundi TaxID=2220096 RepID=UPI000E6AAE64|nr:hypothetical protein [Indioceanicola profundi]